MCFCVCNKHYIVFNKYYIRNTSICICKHSKIFIHRDIYFETYDAVKSICILIDFMIAIVYKYVFSVK